MSANPTSRHSADGRTEQELRSTTSKALRAIGISAKTLVPSED